MMEKIKKLIRLLLFFYAAPTYSQILNIDKIDTAAYSSKPIYAGNISCGLEIDKQKTVLFDATNVAELIVQKNKNLFLFGSSYRFTYNGADDILDAGYFHFRYRYGYKEKYQPEPYIQYQWDNKRGLKHRYLVGCNARYLIAKNKKTTYNIGLGLMYENETWNYAAVDSLKIPSNAADILNAEFKLNSSLRIDYKISENSDISLKFFVQNGFKEFNPRISPLFQLRLKISNHTSFAANFSGMYDNKPLVPIDQFFFSFSNTLLFNF